MTAKYLFSPQPYVYIRRNPSPCPLIVFVGVHKAFFVMFGTRGPSIGRKSVKLASLLAMLPLSTAASSNIPFPVSKLTTPSVVLERSVVIKNSQRMLERAEKLGVELRPHVKTHKSIQGALIQTNNRTSKITVSTLAEAEWFAEAGFSDIVYAVPIDPTKVERAARLCEKTSLHVMIDNLQQLDALLAHSGEKPWSIVLMCDSGYGRGEQGMLGCRDLSLLIVFSSLITQFADGVDVDSDEAMKIVERIKGSDGKANLYMLYTHGGHSYDVEYGNIAEIVQTSEQERDTVVKFAKKLYEAGLAEEVRLRHAKQKGRSVDDGRSLVSY